MVVWWEGSTRPPASPPHVETLGDEPVGVVSLFGAFTGCGVCMGLLLDVLQDCG